MIEGRGWRMVSWDSKKKKMEAEIKVGKKKGIPPDAFGFSYLRKIVFFLFQFRLVLLLDWRILSQMR